MNQPLRILHVISSLAAEAGGPPVVCAGLAAALVARGHELTIAAIDDPHATLVPLDPAIRLASFPVDGITRYRHSAGLARWLDEYVASFDIVHLHSIWLYPTFAAARDCWQTSIPYVVLLNGMLDEYSVNQHSRRLKRLYWLLRERRIHRRAAGIHFLNRAEIRRAVPWIRNLPKFVVGNAIASQDLTDLPPRGRFRAAHPEIADAPLALFLSRIHPKKGLDRLLPAWTALAGQMPNLRFAIAGNGDAEYVASIDRLIASLHLEKNVIRVGQLVGLQKWEALVDADLFILPSHQEGFSMAITEALAAGCPPVVTDDCNFDELEEHHCGLIIRNGDMSAFTRAVQTLLNDPTQRQSLAAAGQSLVRSRFTWDKVAADMEQVYRHILAGKPLPPDGADIWRNESSKGPGPTSAPGSAGG